MERVCLSLLAILLSACYAQGALPKTFTVSVYNVTLTVPDTGNAVEGSVLMELTCVTDTNEISFHWGESLTPKSPAVTDFTVTNLTDPTAPVVVTVSSVKQNTTAHTVTLVTTPPSGITNNFVNSDVITVVVKFSTIISKGVTGLFYRQYPDGITTSTMIASNLQPGYAREVFPCLDEPSFPAGYNVIIKHGSIYNSSSTSATSKDYVLFPPSSLNIFLTGMISTSYSVSSSSTTLIVWGRKSFLSDASFQKNLDFLASYYYQVEDFLNTNLPLTALHIVLVPGLEAPFAGYGVIYIREESYYDNYTSPQMEGMFRLKVVPVVHQFIRQFTEFSITTGSWSDYWLSPAIARFLQHALLTTSVPSMIDFRTDLEVEDRQTALAMDIAGSNPLQDTFINGDSIAEVEAAINDPLKATKGAVLLSMLDQSFPAGTVFSAIKSFLKNYKSKTASSADFYNQIKSAVLANGGYLSPDSTTALDNLHQWFDTSGYPLLNVSIKTVGTPGTVELTSAGFCLQQPCGPPQVLAISATVGSKSEPRYYTPRQDIWVKNNSVSTSKLVVANGDWVVANLNSGGFYRTQYSSDNWAQIQAALTRGNDEIMGRSQLLDDGFALSVGGFMDFNNSLRLAVASVREKVYRNWYPLDRGLRQIRDVFWGLPPYTAYKDFAGPYFQNAAGFLANQTINDFEKARIFSLLVDDMCEHDIFWYRNAALSNLTALLKGELPESIPSSGYEAVVCCGAQYSTILKAQTLWADVTNISLSYYRRRFNAVSLGCLSNYTDVSQYFDTILSSDLQLRPYVLTIFQYLAQKQPINLVSSLPSLVSKLQTQLGAAATASIIVATGRRINNDTQAAMLSPIANVNVDNVVKTAVVSTIASVSSRLVWLKQNNVSLVQALQYNKFPSSTSGATITSVIYLLVLLPTMFLSLSYRS